MRQEQNTQKEAGNRSPQTLAPTLACAQRILRYAALNGLVSWTRLFLRKCSLHQINTTDAVAIICAGTVVQDGKYDWANNGWRYRIVGFAEGRKLCVEVLLDCAHDFHESPFVTLTTACWWRGRVRSPKE